ncbi:hypothetical protein [Bacteroides clarus]
MKENKQKSLDDIINELSTKYDDKSIVDLREAYHDTKKEIRGNNLLTIFLGVIFLCTFIAAFITFENLDRLKADVKEKEYIINRYKTIVDNGELPTSYIAKGDSSIMTYQDLTKEYNRLLDERYKYSNEANRLKFYLDVIKSTYGIEVAIRNNAVYFTPSVVDSALRIYPFFKKYARFNPDGSVTIHLKE